jgi:hypothetical protein
MSSGRYTLRDRKTLTSTTSTTTTSSSLSNNHNNNNNNNNNASKKIMVSTISGNPYLDQLQQLIAHESHSNSFSTFRCPDGICSNSFGSLFVCDTLTIRKVNIHTGVAETIFGEEQAIWFDDEDMEEDLSNEAIIPRSIAINENETKLYFTTDSSLYEFNLETKQYKLLINFRKSTSLKTEKLMKQTEARKDQDAYLTTEIRTTTNNEIKDHKEQTKETENDKLIGKIFIFQHLLFVCEMKRSEIICVDLNTLEYTLISDFSNDTLSSRLTSFTFDQIRGIVYCAALDSILKLEIKTNRTERWASQTTDSVIMGEISKF